MSLSRELVKIVVRSCVDTNTPRALTVKLLLEAGELDQLFRLETDPRNYADPELYFKDIFVTEFLRKLETDIPGIDRARNAELAFYANEAQCAKSNARLSALRHHAPLGPNDGRIMEILSMVRKNVRRILGLLPNDIELRFGPGATFDDRGRLTTIPDKMSSRPTVTASSQALLPFWERSAWARSRYSSFPLDSSPKVIRGNRFTTVPKDALKRRGICIEPSINVSLQLGVGRYLKSRLRSSGLDLLNGQEIHRSIACSASRSGEFATIDLSNASDTICTEFVRLCVPGDWHTLLNTLRSPTTLISGKTHFLSKFSSMGNGFTFELETLLFASVCLTISQLRDCDAVLGNGIWVYGDDIIVPTTISADVVSFLRYLGLEPNYRKTFLEGPFRESCGGDFFDGVPVRAHYQKVDPHEPQEVIAMANGIRRVLHSSRQFTGKSRQHLLGCWRACLDLLPSEIKRLRGPESLGDLVIHDISNWIFRETKDKRGFIRTYSPVSTSLGWSHWKPDIVLASALYGVPDSGPLARDSVSGYRIKWTDRKSVV